MKIGITGSSGYIGSFLRRLCVGDASGYDLKNDQDVRILKMQQLITRNHDVIIHLAALSGLKACSDAPDNAKETNTKAAVDLAYAAKKAGCKRFIFASTSSIYGETSDYVLDEYHQTVPRSVYGQTKLKAESILGLADDKFEVVILRKSNVFGRGTQLKGITVIDKFIECYLGREDISIMGDGTQKRDFVHIADVCTLYNKIANLSKVRSGIYNVGGNDCVSIKALAKKINDIGERIFGYRVGVVFTDPDGGITSHDFRYDYSKARMEFKYRPLFNINEYIKERMLNEIRGIGRE